MINPDHVAIPILVEEETHSSPPLALPAHESLDTQREPCLAPDLVGLEAIEAHDLASSAGVHLKVSVWRTSVGPWGQVLDQRPAPDSRVRRGSRVHVIVAGRPLAPVPDVRGLPLDAATKQLCWLGLVPIALTREPARDVPAGHLVSTRPSAGALVPEGSVVGLILARPIRVEPSRNDVE